MRANPTWRHGGSSPPYFHFLDPPYPHERVGKEVEALPCHAPIAATHYEVAVIDKPRGTAVAGHILQFVGAAEDQMVSFWTSSTMRQPTDLSRRMHGELRSTLRRLATHTTIFGPGMLWYKCATWRGTCRSGHRHHHLG